MAGAKREFEGRSVGALARGAVKPLLRRLGNNRVRPAVIPLAGAPIVVFIITLGFGCNAPQASAPSLRIIKPQSDQVAQVARWTSETASPQPLDLSAEDLRLLQHCDAADRGLMTVAQELAEQQASTSEFMGNDQLRFEMRAAGVPYVWPRLWSDIGDISPGRSERRLRQWLSTFDDGGSRRCGVGRTTAEDGKQYVSVLAVDALADLKPIPTQASTGDRISIEALLHEEASQAELMVLAPHSAPRTIASTLRDGVVRGQLLLDQPGRWTIQVLPTFRSGPRPVLEAVVFADYDPPDTFHAMNVPGEHAGSRVTEPSAALLAMLNAARRAEGLRPLAYSEQLTKAAVTHAQAMLDARLVAHDVGRGDPTVRIAEVGLQPVIAGENVAHAATVQRAHRAIWASPSHRSNLLRPDFTHVGVGLAQDPQDGSLWVCQLFAELPASGSAPSGK